jgi:hypothetical protein
MENKILFNFYIAMPGSNRVMYRAFFDGSCAPVGEGQKVGQMLIGKKNREPFANLAEALPIYIRMAVAAKRASEGDNRPLAEPFVGLPESERADVFIDPASFDYVMETAAEFARSL